MRIGTLVTLGVASFGGCIAVSAQEYAYEKMMGLPIPSALGTRSPAPSIPVLAYGEETKADFPPRAPINKRKTGAKNTAAYCVRTCDGRYFPASSVGNESKSDGCSSLCPASEMQVFYGSSIDSAYSQAGKPYSSLSNALRYRTELVDGCTCNGKDTVGLARIKIEDDMTLRRGDIVATADGLQVIRKVVVGSTPQFAEAPKSVKAQFEGPSRIASTGQNSRIE